MSHKLDQQFSPYDFGPNASNFQAPQEAPQPQVQQQPQSYVYQNSNNQDAAQTVVPMQFRQDSIFEHPPQLQIAQDSPYAALMGSGGNMIQQQPPVMQHQPQAMTPPPQPQQPMQHQQQQIMHQQHQQNIPPPQMGQQAPQMNNQFQNQQMAGQQVPQQIQQPQTLREVKQTFKPLQPPGGIAQQYQNNNLMTSYKTADERQKTMKKIIEKHAEKVLQKDEREQFYGHKFKVDMCRMFSNGVLIMSLYKLITMQQGHPKRLALFRLLLLQIVAVGGELHFNKPCKALILECSNKHLNHLNDKQLDTLLETGSPSEMIQQNYNSSPFAQQQQQMAQHPPMPNTMQQGGQPPMPNQYQMENPNPYQQQYQIMAPNQQQQQPPQQQYVDANMAQVVEQQLQMRQGLNANMPIKE